MAFFYGCTGASTDQVIDNVRFAHSNGADGAVIAAPPYISAPEADIEQFYLEVADAVELPLGIYNNPPRVKPALHRDQLLRMFRHSNSAIKQESTGSVGEVEPILCGGPHGPVICSVCSNTLPL